LFALPGGHNVLNGTFHPFGVDTDCGWWGSELSDGDGYLPHPAVLTVHERVSAYIYSIRGIQNNFPVDFTLTLYRNGATLKTVEIAGNVQSSIDISLDQAYDIDQLSLSVTRISSPNDVLKIATASFGLGVSSLMKQHDRRIHGRVEVTYANAIKDSVVTVNEGAHGSSGDNLTNGEILKASNFFKLYDNKLDGSYVVAGPSSETGWWPRGMPNEFGAYAPYKTLSITFSRRNLHGFRVVCDTLDYIKDCDITFTSASGSTTVVQIRNAASAIIDTTTLYRDVVKVDIDILSSSRPYRPAVILEANITSAIVYEDSALIDVSLLEELTYEDALEKLGGVSANELTVNFSNEDNTFYFNNPESRIAGYIKKNRKVRAWLGVQIPDGEDIIWSPLGTFWTHSWDVPVGSLVAKMTAFDTIGLLSTQPYYNHHVYRDVSVGTLIDIVLSSAKESLTFLQWRVDAALYDIVIPVAWFEYGSYTMALNRIASCDFVNIYCARDGSIVASRRLSGVQSPDDVWTDSTNVVDKSYPTLYTAPANYIDVHITRVTASEQEIFKLEGVSYAVNAGEVRVFNFSKPAERLSSVTIDTTAAYTYEWFSWGMRVTFATAGVLAGATIVGTALDVGDVSQVHVQEDESVEENGVIPCEIKSDFIQTAEHASRIASYLYSKVPSSIYEVDVTYRGDIALTLNNKISLPEGIAPDNLYFIKRHELNWNGSLSGSARLTT
jgi:hypothetical protein